MKNHVEKIAILSLSLVLTSMLVVSASIPILTEHFNQYSRASIETLISIPAFPMTIMVALSPFLAKILNERVTIILGLLLVGIAGSLPAIFTSFSVIFIARIFLGIGLGLINTRAISIIGERWDGSERATLLGFRGSAETLGQTVMTIFAGLLLSVHWTYSFYVYLIALPILVMYLLFVSSPKKNTVKEQAIVEEETPAIKMTQRQAIFIGTNALFIGLLICINVSNALRIPSVIVELGYGTDVQASRILSIMMFTGFLSGLVFGKLIQRLAHKLLPFSLFAMAAGLLLIGLSNQLIITGVGVIISGFSTTTCITYVFNHLSEKLPKTLLNTGMSIVLVGCNLGAFFAPFIMNIMGMFNRRLTTSFFGYAIIILFIAICLTLLKKNKVTEKYV